MPVCFIGCSIMWTTIGWDLHFSCSTVWHSIIAAQGIPGLFGHIVLVFFFFLWYLTTWGRKLFQTMDQPHYIGVWQAGYLFKCRFEQRKIIATTTKENKQIKTISVKGEGIGLGGSLNFKRTPWDRDHIIILLLLLLVRQGAELVIMNKIGQYSPSSDSSSFFSLQVILLY